MAKKLTHKQKRAKAKKEARRNKEQKAQQSHANWRGLRRTLAPVLAWQMLMGETR